jgi:hypothetical protein
MVNGKGTSVSYADGVFSRDEWAVTDYIWLGDIHGNNGIIMGNFKLSNAVLTGNDNSPRTLSERFWRRVA